MVQLNLTLPPTLQKAAQAYVKRFGFRNVQDLATEAVREKVFFQKEYDEELTQKEINIIEKFIDATLNNKRLIMDEKELDKALLR